MKRAWHPEELVEHWTILPGEWPLIEHKHGATRLGFAVLFKFFQYAGAFPRAPQDVSLTVVDHVAQQVGVPADTWPSENDAVTSGKVVFERFLNQQFRCSLASHLSYDIHKRLDHSRGRITSPRQH